MHCHPPTACESGPMDRDAIFVHAYRGPMPPELPPSWFKSCAVKRSPMKGPVSFALVWLEKVSNQSGKGDLFDEQCLRMGRGVAANMSRLRQEALRSDDDDDSFIGDPDEWGGNMIYN
jgi:hypothetical protein